MGGKRRGYKESAAWNFIYVRYSSIFRGAGIPGARARIRNFVCIYIYIGLEAALCAALEKIFTALKIRVYPWSMMEAVKI